jgi:hypothetical protein
MDITDGHRSWLRDLALILSDAPIDVQITYTTNDDGVWLELNGRREIHLGFSCHGAGVNILRYLDQLIEK